MLKIANRMLRLTSVGDAVLLSLAVAGISRLMCDFSGSPLTIESASRIFVGSVLMLAPIASYLITASIRRASLR